MLAKFRVLLADFGLADTCVFLGNRALQAISGGHWRLLKYYIVAQPVPAPREAAPRRPGGLEVRVLTPDEIIALEWPRPPHVIARRLADGAQCVAAFSKGQMIGFQWTLVGPYEEDEVRTRFVPEPAGQAAWDFDIFVLPEYRIGRAFMRMWEETNARLHEGGVRWTMSRISAFALESRRSHARMQAKEVGACLYLCLGRLQFSLFDRQPIVHVGVSERSRPVFRAEAPLR
jgi:hypothetical protein